jgi:hypothetical protein
MTNQRKRSRAAPTVSPTWSWPLPLSHYDRSSILTVGEAEALASLAAKDRHPRLDRYADLVRLTRPVADALEFTGASKDKSQSDTQVPR